MQGLQAALGLPGDDLWHLATGLGGGIARRQLVCGALSGGVLACGLAAGRQLGATRAERDALRAAVYPKVQALTRAFEAEFGALDCRTLTGHDFAAPGGYQAFAESGTKERVCHPLVRFVVERGGALLAEE